MSKLQYHPRSAELAGTYYIIFINFFVFKTNSNLFPCEFDVDGVADTPIMPPPKRN